MPAVDNRIHVTHVVLGLQTGGLETVVVNLVRHADRRRFAHQVVCLREAGALAPLVEAEGVPVTTLQARGRLGMLCSLVSRLRSSRTHVLHTHNPTPHQIGALARLLLRTPVLVHTKHGRNFPDDRTAVRLNRWCSCWTDVVVSVSVDAADVARRIERVAPEKVLVIQNGIEIDRFSVPRPRERMGHLAICVARLDPVKDVPNLLGAVQHVRRSIPAFQLDLVGEGPDRERIERIRTQMGLEGAVALLGQRADVPELLAGAGLFLLASISEGTPITLLEAMAAGLPIVATTVGGNSEVVVEGETGFLVPSRDPVALGNAVLRLLGTPGLLDRMGAAARRRAQLHFDARVMTKRYEDVYQGLLDARRTGTAFVPPVPAR